MHDEADPQIMLFSSSELIKVWSKWILWVLQILSHGWDPSIAWMDGWMDGCIAFLHENIAIDAAYFSRQETFFHQSFPSLSIVLSLSSLQLLPVWRWRWGVQQDVGVDSQSVREWRHAHPEQPAGRLRQQTQTWHRRWAPISHSWSV